MKLLSKSVFKSQKHQKSGQVVLNLYLDTFLHKA